MTRSVLGVHPKTGCLALAVLTFVAAGCGRESEGPAAEYSHRFVDRYATRSSLHSVALSSSGRRGWAVGNGTILRLGGEEWELVGWPENLVLENLRSVALDSKGESGWAVGDLGLIFRLDRGGAARVRSPTDADLHSVALDASGSTGWAVGDGGTVLRLAGGAWEQVESGRWFGLKSIVLDPSGRSGWAVGANGTILRLAGDRWEGTDYETEHLRHSPGEGLPNLLFRTRADIWAVRVSPSGEEGWAVGAHGKALRLEEGSWRLLWDLGSSGAEVAEAGSPLRNGGIRSIALDSAGRGWAVGDEGTLLRLEEDTWESVESPIRSNLTSVALDSSGRTGWAVGHDGAILQLREGRWKSVGAPSGADLHSMAISQSGDSGWAVGDYGTLLRLQGKDWSAPELPIAWPPSHYGDNSWGGDGWGLRSVALDAAGETGWAVGDWDTVLRLEGGVWRSESMPRIVIGAPGSRLAAVVVSPSRDQGWGVDKSGWIQRLEGAAWQSVESPIELSSIALSQLETVARASAYVMGTRWSPDPTPGLRSVALGSSGEEGWAVGSEGRILRLRDGAWEAVESPTRAGLNAVALEESAREAWAVGDAGAILRLDDEVWKEWDSPVPKTEPVYQRTVDGDLVQTGETAPGLSLRSVAVGPKGNTGWAVGDWGTILRLEGSRWKRVESPTAMSLWHVALDPVGDGAWAVGERDNLLRCERHGCQLLTGVDAAPYGYAIGERPHGLTALALDSTGERGWAVGLLGSLQTMIRDYLPTVRRFQVSEKLELALEATDLEAGPEELEVRVTMRPDGAEVFEPFTREFKYSQLDQVEPWPPNLLADGGYDFELELDDGWNTVTASYRLVLGAPRWERFKAAMGWTPLDFKRVAVSSSVLTAAAYLLAIMLLFAIWPWGLVRWHEAVASSSFPRSARLARFLAPFLVGTGRCLDSIVERFGDRARSLLDRNPEVAARPRWIPAPLRVGDELVTRFDRPRGLDDEDVHVAGLAEFRRHFSRNRFVLSIEGPGGAGKSTLALQILRWSTDARRRFRLASHRMLPVFVEDPGESLDEALAAKLKLLLDAPSVSPTLARALLRKQRVIALVDGLSEMGGEAWEAVKPERGASDTRALVVTSRIPTHLPDSLPVRPQGIGLESLDAVLDSFVAEELGPGALTGEQRECLRGSIKELVTSLSGTEEGSEADSGLPMIFLRLIVQRAGRLLEDGRSLAELPDTVIDLVQGYVEDLLRAAGDVAAVFAQARRAARICLGPELVPTWRPRDAYLEELPAESLESFVEAGLMVQGGSAGDPRLKLTFDPVAEHLAAWEMAIALRDGAVQADDLVGRLEEMDAKRWPFGFLGALGQHVEREGLDLVLPVRPSLELVESA